MAMTRTLLTDIAREAKRRQEDRQALFRRLAEVQEQQQKQQAVADLRACFGYNFGDLDQQLRITFTYGEFGFYTGGAGVIQVDESLRLITLQEGWWWVGSEANTREVSAGEPNNRDQEPARIAARAEDLILALASSLEIEIA